MTLASDLTIDGASIAKGSLLDAKGLGRCKGLLQLSSLSTITQRVLLSSLSSITQRV